jgi:hypothetical protein
MIVTVVRYLDSQHSPCHTSTPILEETSVRCWDQLAVSRLALAASTRPAPAEPRQTCFRSRHSKTHPSHIAAIT